MSDNTIAKIQKIYDLKALGADEVLRQLIAINAEFTKIRITKDELNAQKANISDPAQLELINTQLKNLYKIQNELLVLTRQLVTASKEKSVLIDLEIKQQGQMQDSMKATGTIGDKITASLSAGLNQVKGQTASTALGFASFRTMLEQAAISEEQFEAATKDTGLALGILKNQQSSLRAQMKELEGEFQRGAVSEAEYNSQLSEMTIKGKELQTVITEINASLKGEIQVNYASIGSIKAARAERRAMNEELINLNLTTEEGTKRQKELIAAIDEKDSFIKNNVDSYTKQKINIGNYPTLTTEFAAVTAEKEAMIARGEQGSDEFNKLSAYAEQLKNSLTQVNEQMGSLGKELSVITKRLQELVLNGEQGSEEFKVLTLRAQELKGAMTEVNAAIKEQSTITDKFTNIAERMGIRFLANMFIFQAAFEIFAEVEKKIEEAIERANLAENTIANINIKASETYSQLGITLEMMRDRFNSASATMEDKKEVAEELNSKYKDMAGGINSVNDAESFFRDKGAAFIDAMQLRAKAMGALAVAQEAYQKYIKVQATGGKSEMSWSDYVLATLKGSGRHFGITEEISESSSNKVQQAQEDYKAIKAITDKEFQDAQNAAAALDKKYGFETDQNQDKSKAPKKLQDLTNKILEEKKKLLQFQSEFTNEQVKQDAAKQQEIFEQERNGLDKRLKAYQYYVADMLTIMDIEKQTEIDAVQSRLDKINEIKKKKDPTHEEKALLTEEESLQAQLLAIIQKYATKSLQLNLQTKKQQLDILKSGLQQQNNEVNAEITEQINNLQNNINQQLAHVMGSKRSGANKDESIRKLTNAGEIEKNQQGLTEDEQQLQQNEEAYQKGAITFAEYENAKSAILEREAQHRNAIRSKEREEEQKAKDDRTKILDEFSSVMQRGTQSYISNIQQQIDYNYKLKEDSLNNNKTRAMGQAQSSQQQLTIEQQFNVAQTQLNRQKAQEEKKLKEGQLSMEYSLAEMKAINNALDTEGVGLIIAIGEATALTAIYAQNMATLQRAQFYDGGYTGWGNNTDVAGITHKNEFVVSHMGTTAENMPYLEAMNKGYSMSSLQYHGGLGNHLQAPVFGSPSLSSSSSEMAAMKESMLMMHQSITAIANQKVYIVTNEMNGALNKYNKKTSIGTL